ncbi:MAG: hypothetical protein Q7J25_09110 [Vicinamibacterales bacterium]|nr:hypothetical protein [Vicinamibacterales bacterium]
MRHMLDARLRTLLPPLYQDTYEDVQPVSMGSAGLKYGPDGKVAWDEIWRTFCDLALAGGPPHRGTLLEAATPADVARRPGEHAGVVAEICRGVQMVTGLRAAASPHPGWVRVTCERESMTSWLLRAIVTENISARQEGGWLDLPAGPGYRVEKEIKNVITSMAKTCHYWSGHIPPEQRERIATLFVDLALDSPLVVPWTDGDSISGDGASSHGDGVAAAITGQTALTPSPLRYRGWLGLECGQVGRAVWMMRALVTENVLARREGTVLFVPINPRQDPDGRTVIAAVTRVARASVASA